MTEKSTLRNAFCKLPLPCYSENSVLYIHPLDITLIKIQRSKMKPLIWGDNQEVLPSLKDDPNNNVFNIDLEINKSMHYFQCVTFGDLKAFLAFCKAKLNLEIEIP